jgi:hypothetical protein
MTSVSTTKELRQFGLMVGGIFLAIGLWPIVFRGESLRLWAVLLGGGLASLGAVLPASLKYVYQGWMSLGHALGWVNTRIILGVIFFGLITPMAVVMRMAGKDAMRLALNPESSTYRIVRSPRSSQHMKTQF